MINPAALRELRQAQLELLEWRFDVQPLEGGLSWCVTAWTRRDIEHGPRKHFYRPVRSQALEAALTWATVEELNVEERRDTEPAPAMGDEHAAE